MKDITKKLGAFGKDLTYYMIYWEKYKAAATRHLPIWRAECILDNKYYSGVGSTEEESQKDLLFKLSIVTKANKTAKINRLNK